MRLCRDPFGRQRFGLLENGLGRFFLFVRRVLVALEQRLRHDASLARTVSRTALSTVVVVQPQGLAALPTSWNFLTISMSSSI